VATDDDLIFPAGEHRLDKPELPQAPLQGVELIVADPSRVGRSGRSSSRGTCSTVRMELRAKVMRCAPPLRPSVASH
jgi:hypothetical protein